MDNLASQPPRYALYACSGLDLTEEPSVQEQVNAGIAEAAKSDSGWILGDGCIFVDVVPCHRNGFRHGLVALINHFDFFVYNYLLMPTAVHDRLHPDDQAWLADVLDDNDVELRFFSVPDQRELRGEGASKA